MPIVYIATNRTNGKRYVGLTLRSLKKRKKQHLYQARRPKELRQTKFTRALFKWELCNLWNFPGNINRINANTCIFKQWHFYSR